MRLAKQKEGNYTVRKPKTLIIAAKKAPFPKLILNSVLLLTKRNRSSQTDKRTRPIHTTSTHCETAKQRYITESSEIN